MQKVVGSNLCSASRRLDKSVSSAVNGYRFRITAEGDGNGLRLSYAVPDSGLLALTALTVTRLREAFTFTTSRDLRVFVAHSLSVSSNHRLDMT